MKFNKSVQHIQEQEHKRSLSSSFGAAVVCQGFIRASYQDTR